MSPISQQVWERVAAAEGKDPAALPPLYDAVDPDSLDDVFASPAGGPERTRGAVRFDYSGFEVTVTAAGEISLAKKALL